MAKFFVGQRVRLVRSSKARLVPIGSEGVITSLKHYPKGSLCHDFSVLLEDGDCTVKYYAYGDRTSSTSRLEPILPEGAQPLGYSFEQMMSEFGVKEAVK